MIGITMTKHPINSTPLALRRRSGNVHAVCTSVCSMCALALAVAMFGSLAAAQAQTNTNFGLVSPGYAHKGPPPTLIPGSATITVKARGIDGSLPVGCYCDVAPDPVRLPQQGPRPPDWPREHPSIVGSNGDWVVYNVMPFQDGWDVRIQATNYAPAQPKRVYVDSNQKVSISFVLPLGATATGRVMDARTSLPIQGALADGGHDRQLTDAAGKFTLKLLTSNSWIYVRASGQDYVSQMIHPTGLEEGATIALPDAELNKGGWISGRAVAPTDAPPGPFRAEVRLPERRLPYTPGQWWVDPPLYGYGNFNGVFRLGPLPPGYYQLNARFDLGKSEDPWQAQGLVGGIKVDAGHDTTNVVIETKTTRPSNGRGR
jgi:hypothetical protein